MNKKDLKLFFNSMGETYHGMETDHILIEYFSGEHGLNNLTLKIADNKIVISSANDECKEVVVRTITFDYLLSLAEKKLLDKVC